MADLRNYISQIKKSKDLKIVKTKVSTKFEISGITAKVDGSHAVLFENIKESNFSLIANLVGTRKRFALAVGGTEDNIHEKVISAPLPSRPSNWPSSCSSSTARATSP